MEVEEKQKYYVDLNTAAYVAKWVRCKSRGGGRMTLLFDLMDEYKDALHTNNQDRIKRLGKIIREYMKELEERKTQ